MSHPTREDLDAGWERLRASPRHTGRLEAIVTRPQRDARCRLEECRLDSETGAHGDRWAREHGDPALPGLAPPHALDGQLTLMNSRVADLVARSRDRWALAGDQLYVDFDLSEDHLRAGDRLRIGEDVVLEITPKAHNGCRKFAARFGEAALDWVNSAPGRHHHLRGLYARVLGAGTIRVGDPVMKLGTPGPGPLA